MLPRALGLLLLLIVFKKILWKSVENEWERLKLEPELELEHELCLLTAKFSV